MLSERSSSTATASWSARSCTIGLASTRHASTTTAMRMTSEARRRTGGIYVRLVRHSTYTTARQAGSSSKSQGRSKSTLIGLDSSVEPEPLQQQERQQQRGQDAPDF